MIAVFAFAMTCGYAHAQEGKTQANTVEVEQPQDSRKMVKPEELPAAVQKTLSSDKYEGWKIDKAYWSEKKKVYEIMMKNTEGKTTKVKLDKEGEPVA